MSTSKFTCTSAFLNNNSSVLGTFDTPGVHKFEYIFTKNVKDNTLSLEVAIDNISDTYIYSFSDLNFSLNLINMELSNNYTETTAFRVENLEVGYVPSLAAFEGESILIPTDLDAYILSEIENPVYSVANRADTNLIDGYNLTHSTENVSGSEYATIYLLSSYGNLYINSYDYLTIEYDISVSEGVNAISCVPFLVGIQNGSTKQFNASRAWISVDQNENKIYAINNEKTHMSAPAENIHVKYVISGDRVQVFFNDILYNEASGVFTESDTLREVRVKSFSGIGEINFNNLKVVGYKTAEGASE